MAKSRGKYSHIIDRLPRWKNEDLAYVQKIEETKKQLLEELPDRHATTMARKYAELRAEEDELEAAQKALTIQMEAIVQLMTDQFEQEGTTSMKLDNGQAVRLQYEPHASVKDRASFLAWCIKEGLSGSLQLPWQTTNKLTKELLAAGEKEPDGVEVFIKVKPVLSGKDTGELPL